MIENFFEFSQQAGSPQSPNDPNPRNRRHDPGNGYDPGNDYDSDDNSYQNRQNQENRRQEQENENRRRRNYENRRRNYEERRHGRTWESNLLINIEEDDNNTKKTISKFNEEVEKVYKKDYEEEIARFDSVKKLLEKLKQLKNDKSKELLKVYKNIYKLQSNFFKKINLSDAKKIIAKLIKEYNNLDEKQAKVYMNKMNKLKKLEEKRKEIILNLKSETNSKSLNKFLENSLTTINKKSISQKNKKNGYIVPKKSKPSKTKTKTNTSIINSRNQNPIQVY
jgi:FMN phosphatase YigB (HAD superfamily)